MRFSRMRDLDYKTRDVPDWYCCDKCGKHAQLFRPYNIMFVQYEIETLCRSCASQKEYKPQKTKFAIPNPPDQIGWYVAAVPTPTGANFWGYSSVPDDGVEWWYSLPK